MDDERSFDEMRRVVAKADPVPSEVTMAARSAIAWRRMDAGLAELLYDSAVDEDRLAGVRGGEGPRLLTFEGEDLTVEVEVSAERNRRRLVGQIVPPQPAVVHVRHGGESLRTVADALGRFLADEIAAGPVSLRCEPEASGAAVETGWVSL